MQRPALWRRRELIVPTIWGWLLVSLIVVTACIVAVQQAYSFLAMEKPSGASVLVVEGWMAPEDLDQSIALIRKGNYQLVITTGGPSAATVHFPNSVSYAVLARDYLIRQGIPTAAITAVPTPRSAVDRTYLSAVTVRDLIAHTVPAFNAIDVFSAAVHSRRTQLLYQMAFGPQTRIGVFSARPSEYDPGAWWQTSVGAKTVIMESISWLWTVLFFNPPPRGSHEEKWGAPRINAPAG